MAQLWGGRFIKETDQLVYNFNASISFDKRFYEQDIRGSIAHVTMLAKQGILTEEEKKQVDAFVEQIQLEDSTSILQYGAGTQKKMSDFSEGTLEKVRSKDLGEIGDLLNGVVVELKGFDEEEEKLIWSNCGECEEIDWNMLFDTDKKYYVGIVKFKEEE